MNIRNLSMMALLFPLLAGCFPLVATGVGAGVAMIEDRRSTGAYVDDQSIELKAGGRISEKLKDEVHINVTSFNRNVLLTGEAPSEKHKADAERLVMSVPNVRSISNEIAIAGASSLGSRSNDALLTSKVKGRFFDAGKFYANHVKVVTENGVVYLIGLVKQKEAEDAKVIASSTGGVQKVVTVFEYLD